MEQNFWRAQYSSFPAFQCPRCLKGKLESPERYIQVLQARYAKAQANIDGEPEWRVEKFTRFLVCDRPTCGEVVAVAGIKSKYTEHSYDHHIDDVVVNSATYYTPSIMSPSPHVIAISKNLNKECAEHLRRSFDLLWVDPASCANRIRVFVECLMDKYKIPRTTINKKGEEYDLTLYRRIQLLEEQKPGHSETFHALRNVGNFASHQGKAKFDTLVACYEILEDVLADLVDGKRSRLKSIVAKLSEQDGEF